MERLYFPNLNGLRFIAALFVMISHYEYMKSRMGLINIVNNPTIVFMGKGGVTIFFTLSGFLITYLLLCEKEKRHRISLINFYVRRILRIWPLYYVITLAAFFIWPHITALGAFKTDPATYSLTSLFFGLFFLSNIRTSPVFAQQTWSVSTEEQFYLFWPLVMKVRRSSLLVIVVFLIVFFLLKFVIFSIYYLYYKGYIVNGSIQSILAGAWQVVVNINFSSMAIGALGATIYYNKENYSKLLDMLYSTTVQVVTVLLMVLQFSGYFRFALVVEHDILSLLSGILILNLATNPKSIISLEAPYLNRLGQISYGLYMYHLICQAGVLILLGPIISQVNYFVLLIVFFATFFATFFVSYLSYWALESPLLKLKRKFSTILSGDMVKIR